MGQRHCPASDELTVETAARRLEVPDLVDVARAAFDHAGELASLEHGRRAAVLGAVRLASRRDRSRTLDLEAIEATFAVDPTDVVAAEASLSRYLSSPADDAEIRSVRRRLIVARELLAAAERGRVAGPELPGSSLADAAPDLLARASGAPVGRDDRELRGLDDEALRAHVERLEADLEFARRGAKLDALVDD